MAASESSQVVNLTVQQFGAFALVLLASWVALWWVTFRLRRQEHDEAEAREAKLTADIEAANARERGLYAQLLTVTGDLAPMLSSVQTALRESTATNAKAQHAIDHLDER